MKYQYGLRETMFKDIEPEELYMLAAIGYYHVRELAEDLEVMDHSRLAGTSPSKKADEEMRLMALHANWRDKWATGKESALNLYAMHKQIAFTKLIKQLEKERADKDNETK